MKFLDASVDRHAPSEQNPVQPTDANLTSSMYLYKTYCAMCHVPPDHPEKNFGHPFYPSAPNFLREAPDMPENQNFYITVEVKVPFGELVRQVEERLRLVELNKDLPRRRNRAGWKKEFQATLKEEAAQDMGDVSTVEILKSIRQYQNDQRRKPQVTLEARPAAARAWSCSRHVGGDFGYLGLQWIVRAGQKQQCRSAARIG